MAMRKLLLWILVKETTMPRRLLIKYTDEAIELSRRWRPWKDNSTNTFKSSQWRPPWPFCNFVLPFLSIWELDPWEVVVVKSRASRWKIAMRLRYVTGSERSQRKKQQQRHGVVDILDYVWSYTLSSNKSRQPHFFQIQELLSHDKSSKNNNNYLVLLVVVESIHWLFGASVSHQPTNNKHGHNNNNETTTTPHAFVINDTSILCHDCDGDDTTTCSSLCSHRLC